MPLLSQSKREPRRRAPARAAAPVAIVGAGVEARLGEARVTALPDGALWIAEAKKACHAWPLRYEGVSNAAFP